ncbi:MAG: hypothetical protein ABIG39_05570 [Candidatus Micrarchaeota archaeon]
MTPLVEEAATTAERIEKFSRSANGLKGPQLKDLLTNALGSGNRGIRARAAVLALEKRRELVGDTAPTILKEALGKETDPEVATVMLKAYEASVRLGSGPLSQNASETIFSTANSMLDTLYKILSQFEQTATGNIEHAIGEFEKALFDTVVNALYPDTHTNPTGLNRIKEFALGEASESQLLKIIYLLGVVDIEDDQKPLEHAGKRSEIILDIVAAKGEITGIKKKADTALANLGKNGLYEADRPNRLAKDANRKVDEIVKSCP